MPRFIETIRFEKGNFHNLPYHNQRMNLTRSHFFGRHAPLYLENYLDPLAAYAALPPAATPSANDTYTDFPAPYRIKCRVEYGADILAIDYTLYHLRPVHTLRLTAADTFDYTYKSTNRTDLQTLFHNRDGADDILLTRHGYLTDTSICNIALYDGHMWYTPLHPLLAGTQRQALLDMGVLVARPIPTNTLFLYTQLRLFNALIPFGELHLPVTAILPPQN